MFTKQEALAAAEDAQVKAWEARIDAVLRTFDGDREVCINCVACPPKVADRLTEMYVDAGWTVGRQTNGAEWLFRFS